MPWLTEGCLPPKTEGEREKKEEQEEGEEEEEKEKRRGGKGRGGERLALHGEWAKYVTKAIHLTCPFNLASVKFTSISAKFRHPK